MEIVWGEYSPIGVVEMKKTDMAKVEAGTAILVIKYGSNYIYPCCIDNINADVPAIYAAFMGLSISKMNVEYI